ncbi:cupin domain-containing protein [Arthrobacter sp. CAN_A214]|uniref:cupin domain-containing protein n=1 Tax=Arthrobacter sp. CAN_A214 TaxID=2787720 RepID=UPI003FA447B3
MSLHRHAAAEVYQVLKGQGVVTLDGIEHAVRAGSGVYDPSNREEGIRNTGDAPVELCTCTRRTPSTTCSMSGPRTALRSPVARLALVLWSSDDS